MESAAVALTVHPVKNVLIINILLIQASFVGTSGCSLEDLKGWEFGVKARA